MSNEPLFDVKYEGEEFYDLIGATLDVVVKFLNNCGEADCYWVYPSGKFRGDIFLKKFSKD